MPRLTNFKAMVLSADIGGGKAVIELKAAKSTWTIEVAEDSGWAKVLVEGAIVNFPDIEVEVPRESVQLPTGPQPGDEIRTSQGIITIPEPEEVVAIVDATPDPEAIRLANPIRGYNTIGLDGNLSGESARSLLGIPERTREDGAKVGATPSSNDA